MLRDFLGEERLCDIDYSVCSIGDGHAILVRRSIKLSSLDPSGWLFGLDPCDMHGGETVRAEGRQLNLRRANTRYESLTSFSLRL